MAKREACPHDLQQQEGRERIVDAFERSLDACHVDRVKGAAMIAAARRLAEFMDDPDWPFINGRFDNVSPSTFLKYCEQLGLSKELDTDDGEANPLDKLRAMAGGRR